MLTSLTVVSYLNQNFSIWQLRFSLLLLLCLHLAILSSNSFVNSNEYLRLTKYNIYLNLLCNFHINWFASLATDTRSACCTHSPFFFFNPAIEILSSAIPSSSSKCTFSSFNTRRRVEEISTSLQTVFSFIMRFWFIDKYDRLLSSMISADSLSFQFD